MMKKILILLLLFFLVSCKQDSTITIDFFEKETMESMKIEYNYNEKNGTLKIDGNTLYYIDHGYYVVDYSEYVIDNSVELIRLSREDGPVILSQEYSAFFRIIEPYYDAKFSLIEGDLYEFEGDLARVEVLIDEEKRPLSIEIFMFGEPTFKVTDINETTIDLESAKTVDFVPYIMSLIDHSEYTLDNNILEVVIGEWAITYPLNDVEAIVTDGETSFQYQYPNTYLCDSNSYTKTEFLNTHMTITTDTLNAIESLITYYRQPTTMVGVIPKN